MGNYQYKKDDNAEFLKAIRQMNRDMNDKSPSKVSTNLDQKYRHHLFEALHRSNLSKPYKKVLADVLENKIAKSDLTAAVTVLTALKSNQMSASVLKTTISEQVVRPVSEHVVIKFSENMLKKKRQDSGMNMSHFSSGHFQETEQGRVKLTAAVVCRQINRPYHPFRFLCKRYAQFLGMDQNFSQECSTETQYEQKQKLLRKNINQFCKFLVDGCIGLYRKWILDYTGIEEKQYEKWIFKIAIDEVWYVSDCVMGKSIYQVISNMKVPLKIDLESLKLVQMHMVPENFGIDEELRIQGHYFKAIYQLSELPMKVKPSDLLSHLENIKNYQYHKLAEKGEVYEINGDNIMGIVAYLICKVAFKVDEISTVLLFLKLIYGEIIFYGMDVGSYMYSTISGAIEYLESKDFSGQKEIQLKNTGCSSLILQK